MEKEKGRDPEGLGRKEGGRGGVKGRKGGEKEGGRKGVRGCHVCAC